MTQPEEKYPEDVPPWWTAVEKLRSNPADDSAWQRLVDGVWPMLVVSACRGLGHRQVTQNAEIAASDALVYVAQHWPPRASATPWRFRRFLNWLVHRRVIDERRASARQRGNGGQAVEQLAASHIEIDRNLEIEEFEATNMRDERDLRIWRLLRDGWTQLEIAEELGVHPSTISRKLNRLHHLWRRFQEKP